MSVIVRKKNKSTNVWWIFINHQGRRKSRKVGSRSAANAAKIQIETAIAAGSFNFGQRQEQKDNTLKHYSELWLATNDCRDKTDVESIYRNHIASCPLILSPVANITRGDVKRFLKSKRKTLSASTVIHIKSFLSRALELALDDDLIQTNPAVGITIHKGRRFEANPYDRDEIESLLSAAADGWPDHYPLILFLARTGCRLGEALGLQWDCVHLKKDRYVEIKRNYRQGKLQQTTKTDTERDVDLTPQLCTLLAGLKLSRPSTCGYVFGNIERPIDSDNFRRRVWPKIQEAAGLHMNRIHDLRHSFATNLIAQTKDVYYTSKQLGHKSINTTLGIYDKYKRATGETRIIDALDCTLYAPGTKKEIAG